MTAVAPRRTGTPSTSAPGSWVFRGTCRRVGDPELFFPLGSDTRAMQQAVRAKAFCVNCPVREECLHYALASHQGHGIWGGTTAEERRKLR